MMLICGVIWTANAQQHKTYSSKTSLNIYVQITQILVKNK